MLLPEHRQRQSTPLTRAVSYLILTGGGATGGFLLSLCSMGGGARYPGVMLASDTAHGLWMLGCSVLGAAFGFFLAWRALKKRSE